MHAHAWTRFAPWLGLLGSAIVVTALFLAPGLDLPRETGPAGVEVSRQQVAEAVEAAVGEDPRLADERDRLTTDLGESAVVQALLVAEAFAQGLAESDYIVRNRLVEIQVMSLYERADAKVTAEAVEAYFHENRDRYVTRPRRKIFHLHVGVTNRVTEPEARKRLDALVDSGEGWGEPTRVTEEALRESYGPAFARRIFEMPLGSWSGPVRSGVGWHAVQILAEDEPRRYDLDEVRARVEGDLRRALRQETYEGELERLEAKYAVEWVD